MSQNSLKILFAGTADFSATFLTPIIESQHQVVAVVTQPDKVSGRGKKIQMTKVKEIALQHDIPVYQFTTSLRNPENYQELLKLDFDIMVVVAFGDILPVELLDYPKYRSINVHPSLLPFGRGASPVQNSVLNGDSKTAFCIINMEKTLDTGDILYWQDVDLDAKETSETLFAKLSTLGGPILTKVLDNIEYYRAHAKPQAPLDVAEPKKTYTRKIKKESGRFNPELTALDNERKLRAYTPWPGLFFSHPEKVEDIKIIACNAYNNHQDLNTALGNKAQQLQVLADLKNNTQELKLGTIVAESPEAFYLLCAEQSLLEITKVQLAGKNPVDIKNLRNGYSELLRLGQQIT